jgi:hypothetical protein
MRIRGHSLLCIQGFVGEGYSDEFVDNMMNVVAALRGDVPVTVIDGPDVLCESCPNLSADGCTLHGDNSELGIRAQDRDVMGRLGISPGATLPWGDVLRRIRELIEPDDLDEICGECPWLPLGHCKEGLRRSRG